MSIAAVGRVNFGKIDMKERMLSGMQGECLNDEIAKRLCRMIGRFEAKIDFNVEYIYTVEDVLKILETIYYGEQMN